MSPKTILVFLVVTTVALLDVAGTKGPTNILKKGASGEFYHLIIWSGAYHGYKRGTTPKTVKEYELPEKAGGVDIDFPNLIAEVEGIANRRDNYNFNSDNMYFVTRPLTKIAGGPIQEIHQIYFKWVTVAEVTLALSRGYGAEYRLLQPKLGQMIASEQYWSRMG